VQKESWFRKEDTFPKSTCVIAGLSTNFVSHGASEEVFFLNCHPRRQWKYFRSFSKRNDGDATLRMHASVPLYIAQTLLVIYVTNSIEVWREKRVDFDSCCIRVLLTHVIYLSNVVIASTSYNSVQSKQLIEIFWLIFFLIFVLRFLQNCSLKRNCYYC